MWEEHFLEPISDDLEICKQYRTLQAYKKDAKKEKTFGILCCV